MYRRHYLLGVFSGLLFWAYGSDEIRSTMSFLVVFWIFFGEDEVFCCWIVSRLPLWVCLMWAWVLLAVGFFFFFFLTVMIFDKPHSGGWVLMWVRQNVGFSGCSRQWGWFWCGIGNQTQKPNAKKEKRKEKRELKPRHPVKRNGKEKKKKNATKPRNQREKKKRRRRRRWRE